MEYNRELYHWGKKGMKWGVRRYQNKDGSLTPAGRERYSKEKRESPKKYKGGREADRGDVDRWVTEDTRNVKNIVEESERMTGKLKRANEDAMKKQPKERADLSNMTDAQLRERINRELLERQYNDMFTPQNTNRGREHVNNVLEVTGTVLGITGSALTIALSIRALMGKG